MRLSPVLLLLFACACGASSGPTTGEVAPGAPAADRPPDRCVGLALTQCLGEPGCAPLYDDACSAACDSSSGSADCSGYSVYLGCTHTDMTCDGPAGLEGTGQLCGRTSPWICGRRPPDCTSANQMMPDACDLAGCVPVVPAMDGSGGPFDPARLEAPYHGSQCVPIAASSCTVQCSAPAPPCPSGFQAEGDGSCYTGRCLPAWVCEPRAPDCDAAVVQRAYGQLVCAAQAGPDDPITPIDGCVPAIAAIEANGRAGAAPAPACVPLAGARCTVQCDEAPPPCRDGFAAETDGACYTGRCVPRSVCPWRSEPPRNSSGGSSEAEVGP